jgi:hypothetical protein
MGTEMPMWLAVPGVILLIAAYVFFAWERRDTAKTLIEADLRFHRATDIVIEWELEGDRDTLTYDVTYTDAAGKRQRNRCKISTRDDTSSVYWSTPLVPPTETARKFMGARKFR